MKKRLILVAVLVVFSGVCALAADWPWYLGPKRDGTSVEKGLLRTWPPEGPKVAWTFPLGAGFGGPVVSRGKVYLLDRDEKVGDTLRAIDFATGKELWTFAYGAPGTFMFPGSRTTPTVDGDLVYTVGVLGDFYAINTTTHKPAWNKNIWKDFGGAELPRWGIVQNPLIYGDLVIVAPQTSQATVVAYDKKTGDLKWKSAVISGAPGYVTPSVVKVGTEDHLVMVTASKGFGRTASGGTVGGVDPLTGRVLWTYEGWQCGIPVPHAVDAGQGRILITGGYRAGAAMIKVEKTADSYTVSELFKNPDFGSHTQPPILYKDHFYAHYTINERSDGFVCMTMDGQVKWKTGENPPFVRGGTIVADGLFLMTDGSTKVYLLEPDPTAFKPIASAVVLEAGDNWAPLALVDGKLLVRDQKQLKVLVVGQPTK